MLRVAAAAASLGAGGSAAALGAGAGAGAAPCTITQTVGCYKDGGNDPDKCGCPTLLPHSTTPGSSGGDNSMTRENCASACQQAGFGNGSYYGVEYGKQCFCGNALPADAQKMDDGDCGMACAGDSSEKCGGSFRINIFKADCGPIAPAAAYPCKEEPGKSAVWCDHTQPLETRVSAIVANLTQDEKAGLFVNGASSVGRIHWPGYNWWSEALHGVARDGTATSFPQIIGVASSMNQTLWHALGELTSTEGRGKNNGAYSGSGQYHGLSFWAPNVNIFRDPRWGRGQETPGEDPKINGDYAAAYVSGLQGDDKTYLKTSACLKHYAAYSQEAGRNGFGAQVTSQDMEDTYLPAFEHGVTQGKASSIMCSYNAETYGEGIYGPGDAAQHGAIPSCANKGILNDLARDKWGFNGYITSDCGAVSNVQNNHHYTNNSQETVNAVLQAGMDTDCGGYMKHDTMLGLMQNKQVSMDLIDTALKNLFRVQFRLGFVDPPSLVPWANYGSEVVNTPAHQALARSAADQSLVLLKNAGGVLPFKNDKPKLAVMGRNAKATKNMQGNYYGDAPFLVSPFDGLSKYASSVEYDDGSDASSAAGKVAGVDAVVLVVGLTSEAVRPSDEAEGHDRGSLIMPDKQDEMVNAVAAAAGAKPVVVVIMGGGPIDPSAWKDNVTGIIWCGYPGQSGGDAIADAIFGATEGGDRFGRLTQTWYPEAYLSEKRADDYNMRPNGSVPGRSYRFYTGPTVWKFGDGLHYTQFGHELRVSALLGAADVRADVRRRPVRARAAAAARAEVTVRNAGATEADEVVMLFAAPPGAGEGGTPLRTLVAFDRVHVGAGEATTARFTLSTLDFSVTGRGGVRDAAAPGGAWRLWVGNDPAPPATATLSFPFD